VNHWRLASFLLGFFLATGASAAAAESGLASLYSYSDEVTASGERLNAKAFTAAHRTLPFGTMVLVTHKSSGRSVTVRINDRGPFIRGRVIDLTPAAAARLGFSGLAPVILTLVRAPSESTSSQLTLEMSE
jgi:rare lipoprotein A